MGENDPQAGVARQHALDLGVQVLLGWVGAIAIEPALRLGPVGTAFRIPELFGVRHVKDEREIVRLQSGPHTSILRAIECQGDHFAHHRLALDELEAIEPDSLEGADLGGQRLRCPAWVGKDLGVVESAADGDTLRVGCLEVDQRRIVVDQLQVWRSHQVGPGHPGGVQHLEHVVHQVRAGKVDVCIYDGNVDKLLKVHGHLV